ncbi:MAG: Xaa-Pro aminopeptidase, partial [Acidobacteriota bacterium]
MRSRILIALLILAVTAVSQSVPKPARESIPPMPKLLSLREQMDVRESWLRKRLDSLLLPMMKRHGIDAWIVVNEEFHADPVTEYIVPPAPVVGRRDFFVFFVNGEKLEKFAVVRYADEQLNKHYTVSSPPRNEIGPTLKKLVDEHQPKTIALNYGGSR